MIGSGIAKVHRQSGWVTTARVVWIGLALLMLSIFVAGLGPRFDELTTVCRQEPCIVLTLTPPDAAALHQAGYTLNTYATFHIALEVIVAGVNVLLAALILWRKSDDRMGLLFAFMFVIFYLNFMVEADAALYRLYPTLWLLDNVLVGLGAVLFLIVLFLFPTGSFVPRWSRWIVLAVSLLAAVDPLFKQYGSQDTTDQFSPVLLGVFLFGIIVGVYAQVFRYRKVSTAFERQQTKWVIFGLMGVIASLLVWSLFFDVFSPEPGTRLIFNTWVYSGLAVLLILFPVTIMLSIMRYRLFDIDVIIRRTLTYALVTALLAVIFFGSVVVLQQIFSAIFGQAQNDLVTVLSTLAIAALFVPVRQRIQSEIDKRFNRKKYDAQQVLNDFGKTVRDETDLEILTGRLMQVVDDTMQPKTVSVWLKKDARRK